MIQTLQIAVYTATHGYAWSRVPDGLSSADLAAFLADASDDRADFDEEATDACGVIVRRGVAGAYAFRRAHAWDAEGRDADYVAFAFCPAGKAADVDFAVLLEAPFFATPSRTPPASLVYDGPAAAAAPLPLAGRLLCRNRAEGVNPHVIGSLVATYATKADFWTVRLAGSSCTVTTSPWHR